LPKTNKEWWAAKLTRNVERDRENREALRDVGWRVATVWECDLKDTRAIVSSLAQVLPDLKERVSACAVTLT
jgi:DNA mismatch endonuclease (patch repair protein)